MHIMQSSLKHNYQLIDVAYMYYFVLNKKNEIVRAFTLKARANIR